MSGSYILSECKLSHAKIKKQRAENALLPLPVLAQDERSGGSPAPGCSSGAKQLARPSVPAFWALPERPPARCASQRAEGPAPRVPAVPEGDDRRTGSRAARPCSSAGGDGPQAQLPASPRSTGRSARRPSSPWRPRACLLACCAAPTGPGTPDTRGLPIGKHTGSQRRARGGPAGPCASPGPAPAPGLHEDRRGSCFG